MAMYYIDPHHGCDCADGLSAEHPKKDWRALSLQPGDTLLGGQVMALAIDGAGAVKGCKIVATSGSVTPQYGCTEASAERFEANAHAANAGAHQGYMTILVYGHSEHVV